MIILHVFLLIGLFVFIGFPFATIVIVPLYFYYGSLAAENILDLDEIKWRLIAWWLWFARLLLACFITYGSYKFLLKIF